MRAKAIPPSSSQELATHMIDYVQAWLQPTVMRVDRQPGRQGNLQPLLHQLGLVSYRGHLGPATDDPEAHKPELLNGFV